MLRLKIVIPFTIIGLSIIFGALSTDASAATYSASISTSSSLTINASGVGNGTSVGVDNLTVTSTCPSGYNVTIEGPSDTNLYLNGNSSNNTAGTYIAHSSGTTSSPATITGANKGTWGYSTTSSTGTGTFIGLTNTATTLVSKNSASASGGDAIPVYYGVSLPDGIAPGTYQMPGTSAITYYLTRSDNCVSYLVSFNANGGSGTAMSNQRIYEDQATALSSNTYTAPAGKIFKEWNTAADGTGTSYSDGQSVTNIASAGSTLPLYAIWITPLYMQDMNFSQCTTTPMTVYDKRDMQEYTVAKLADGNCWMTKNLNLTGGTALSADDTDVDASYISSFITSNNLTKSGNTIVLPSSSTSGFDTANYSYVYNTGNNTDNCTDPGCYSYYSWDAATLGSGRSISTDNTNAPYSICPKGWKLPTTYNGSGTAAGATDFRNLMIAYGGSNSIQTYNSSTTPTGATMYGLIGPGTIPNFLLAGYFNDSFSDGGSLGLYWSATSSSSTLNTRGLYFHSGAVALADNYVRSFGLSVRCLKEDPALYKKVEKQSKGKQTNDTNATTGIKVNPTAPTTSAAVSANSGVYEYDSSVFGEDTDGAKSDNTKAKIYYYRGILDSYGNTGTYGSSGLSDAYPNYVILQAGDSKATTDTCWRIIRTTGSGGVKMIYNGTWTGSTCANSQANAMIKSPVTTSTFNGTASTAAQARQAVRVGYTHNSTYATTTSSSVAVGTLFGSDSNFSVNNGDSTIKGNLETWFNNTLADFDDADMFESNANYCNDRSAFQNTTGTTATTNLYSYTTSTSTGATYRAYFGPYVRNATSNKAPSLECSRSTVDRYSTDTTAGGNGQLSVPVALITADEASFAGSGSNTAANGSGYSSTSFLRNGSTFWTMSPYYRSGSYAYDFYMNANGYMTYGRVDTAYGIRPVISLVEDTPATSGTGIATDPWVVTIPEEEPDPVPDPVSCAANYICYAPNSYDNSVDGTMGRQSANASTSVKLFASNFSREGYGFAGWNTEPDYSGTFYGPNEDITTPSDMSSGLPLYAVWVKSEGNFQDSSKTASVCNSLTPATYNNEGDEDETTWSISASLSSISALTDTRDNQTYAIARLTDGNCWMIENLRLADKDSSNNDVILSSTNTNNPSLPLTNVYDTSTTSNHLSPTSSIAYTADTAPEGWCTTTSAACYDQSRLRTDNTANRATYTTTTSMSSHNANLYSYGNYYNWYSVTAGNGTYSKSSGVTDGDICPAGWHLPTGTGSGEFGLLSNSLGGYKNASNVAQYMDSSTTPTGAIMDKRLRHFPNNLLYSGEVYGASLRNRGSLGTFWSSSASGSYSAYYLYFYSSGVIPGPYSYYKYYGSTARCVVAPSS